LAIIAITIITVDYIKSLEVRFHLSFDFP